MSTMNKQVCELFEDTISISEDKIVHPVLFNIISSYISPDTQTGINFDDVLPKGRSYADRLSCSTTDNLFVIGGISIKGMRDTNTREIVGRVNITITMNVNVNDHVIDTFLAIEADKTDNTLYGKYYIKYVQTKQYPLSNGTKMSTTVCRQEELYYSGGIKDGKHTIKTKCVSNDNTKPSIHETTRLYDSDQLIELTNSHIDMKETGHEFKTDYTTIFDRQGHIVRDIMSSDIYVD